ncbi:MAG: arylesterase [Herminiimonas sp.]|nr:arylesterase [Herminiimonas sp.]
MASVAPAGTVKLMSSRIVSSPVASETRLPRPIVSIAEDNTMASGMQEFFSGRLRTDAFKALGPAVASLALLCNTAVAATATAAIERASGTAAVAANVRDHSALKTVLVLGDSLSAEYGLTRGTGWVPLLERRLATTQTRAAIVNASISGETTSGGRARLQALLAKHHPDIVVIELGGNDGLRGLQLNATRTNLQEMIDMSKKSGARVLLLGMQIPPNYGGDYTRRFAGLYATLARQPGVTLVPFFLEGLQTRPELFQADRIHPVAAAQPLLLDNVWPYLARLLPAPGQGAGASKAAATVAK